MVKVAATILTNNRKDIPRLLKKASYADIIQVDVMDGKFVPSSSIWLDDIKRIKTRKPKEFHLMIDKPEKHIDDFIKLKPKRIIIHYESTKKLDFLIKKLKRKKIKVGIALNPDTKLGKIIPLLKKIDFVQFMTVYPGYYGSKFQSKVLKKIKALRKISKIEITVDGGVNLHTAKDLVRVGVDGLASGSFIMKSKNSKSAINQLRNINNNK